MDNFDDFWQTVVKTEEEEEEMERAANSITGCVAKRKAAGEYLKF